MPSPFEQLVEEYPVWWVDFLGEHNHIGGRETTRWLFERSRLSPGKRMLDAGAFVGAAARSAALTGVRASATDVNTDFIATGRQMEGGGAVNWVLAASHKLPFADSSFDSVWSLDAPSPPRELSRVCARDATLCICTEVPADNRGGLESFLDEWADYGWRLAAHKQLGLDATQSWRRIEAELVGHRPRYEARYGARGYRGQLDLTARMVLSYERGEAGHGLFVFAR